MRVKPRKSVISIVVVTGPGRREEVLRCLASIQASNYKSLEVILVDNSCNPALSTEVAAEFPKVKTIRMPDNTGIFGFNVGIANAKGEYILALDDDIIVKRDTLRKFVELFQTKLKTFGIISPYAYNPLIKHYYSSPIPEPDNQITFHGSSAFRKEIFARVGYFDKDFFGPLFEDDFALRLLDTGYKIHFAEDIVINHYAKEGSLSKKQIFLNARNKAWLDIKHFSVRYLPLLIVRDLIWIFLLPYRKRDWKAWYYGIKGYLTGWLMLKVPLVKRKVVKESVQKSYLRYYLFR